MALWCGIQNDCYAAENTLFDHACGTTAEPVRAEKGSDVERPALSACSRSNGGDVKHWKAFSVHLCILGEEENRDAV